jgi:uncharacterized damage-inducible protein DinB
MTLQDTFAFHRWAIARTLESCEGLSAEAFTRDLGGSFPSVRDTVAHWLMADNAWAHRVRGEAFRRPTPEETPPDVAALRVAWDSVLDTWDELSRTRGLEEVIAYNAFDGSAYRSSFDEIARHVVNHGSYHRGQIAMMLRLLGHKAASTDWIAFSRQARG